MEQEGKTGEIELKATEPDSDDPEDACDDPEIVKLMIAYFYHLDYLHDKKAVIEVHDSPPPKKKVRLSVLAKSTRATNPLPSPEPVAAPAGPKVYLIEHAKVFAMAVKYHVDPLRDLATHKFRAEAEQHWDHEDLAQAIQLIYTSTADEITQLRSIAVEVLVHHRSDLLKKPEIATLLQSITGLAYDLLMRNPDNIPKPRYTMKSKGGEYRYIPCFNIAAHGEDTRTSSTKICKNAVVLWKSVCCARKTNSTPRVDTGTASSAESVETMTWFETSVDARRAVAITEKD